MVRTSIHACGTATTTLALPKPRLSISMTRLSALWMLSRIRSSPVMPRCTAAARELSGDLAGREIGDLDIVETGNGAAIFAGAARLGQRQVGLREEGLGVFLQPPLGGDGDDERRAHDALPCESASIQIENPTAGIGVCAPSRVSSPS